MSYIACILYKTYYTHTYSYAVLGENSSGKSVLLRCLSGILEQDGGDVMMTDDVPVTSDGSGMAGSLGGSGVGAEQTVTRRHPKIGFAPQVDICIFGDLPTAVNIADVYNLFFTSSIICFCLMAAEFRCAWTDANIPPTVLYQCRQRTNHWPNRREVQERCTDDRATSEHELLGRQT